MYLGLHTAILAAIAGSAPPLTDGLKFGLLRELKDRDSRLSYRLYWEERISPSEAGEAQIRYTTPTFCFPR